MAISWRFWALKMYAGSLTVAPGPTTELRPVFTKCQGFSPISFIVGPGSLPCARAISAMWSV